MPEDMGEEKAPRNWTDAATTERELAKNAIKHHLKNARSARQQ